MAIYQRIFTVSNVGRLHKLFQSIILECRAQGLVALAREYELLYGQWQRELRTIASKGAEDATARILARLKATAVRPDTGLRPHLRDLITSRALRGIATGQVGVADEARLDRAVDPFGRYGPYWRTQEFGTGQPAGPGQAPVPSQIGRTARGYFTGPGFRSPFSRPDPSRFRADARFLPGQPVSIGAISSGSGPRGGVGNRMRIGREIEGRHFIRDGADQALARWRAAIASAETAAIAEIRALRTRPAGSRLRGAR